MFCKKCGNNLSDDALFCKKCGNKVEKKSTTLEEIKIETAPKKPFTWKHILVPVGIIAAVAVLIAGVVSAFKPSKSLPVENGNSHVQQNSGGYTEGNMGGSADENTGGYTGGNTGENTGVNTDYNTGWNAGSDTGSGYTELEPVQTQTYTSSKTGMVFTIPSEGYAEIVKDGVIKTVSAKYESRTPSEFYSWDSIFSAYLDESSDKKISFCLTSKSGCWKTGDKLEYSDLCSEHSKTQDIHIDGTFAYLGTNMNTLISSVYTNYFGDSEFEIVEADSSGKAVKFWFYVEYKISSSSEYYTVEGLANVVRDAEPSSSGESTGGSTSGGSTGGGLITPGKTKCIVCNGDGLVNCSSCNDGFNTCPNCNGTGTYYSYAEGRIVNCNRVGCSAGKIKCTICNGTGKKKCGTCGGDGYR